MAGKMIVIEGTDGSGKGTQSRLLIDALRKEGREASYYDFPQYGQKSAGMVENYLQGKYGSADQVNPRAASIPYAMDRFDASFPIRKDLTEGKVVVCNRYISANMGHQGGKIHDKSGRDKFLAWLEDLEFNIFGIPRPDITILLFVPYKIAQLMVDKKGERAYTKGKKRDIHESDDNHLRDAEKAYLEIAKERNWTIIDCTKDGNMLSVEEIQNMIWEKVCPLVANGGES